MNATDATDATDANYSLTQAQTENINQNPSKPTEQPATLPAHDTDILTLTETNSLASTQTFTTPTQDSHPTFPSRPSTASVALSGSHNATATAETQSLTSTTDAFSDALERPTSARAPAEAPSSLPLQQQYTPTLTPNNLSSGPLAPSTISQWLPDKSSSATVANQTSASGTTSVALDGENATSIRKVLTAGQEEKDTKTASGIASSFPAEVALLVPEAGPSINPVTLPNGASEATKPEAIPTAQYSISEATPPAHPSSVLQSSPESTVSSLHKAVNGRDAEKVPISAGPVLNGKGSSTSSRSEKEIDLEAGHGSEDSYKKEPDTTANNPEVDPNIVGWDGPDDPKNPMNWSGKLKAANIAVIASITFLTQVLVNCSPLASSILAPAVPAVMSQFKSTSQELASFVVSVYVLGYAFGPLIIAPISELYGRLRVYHTCNVLFIIFTIACGVSSNLNMLITWRFFQGTFGSCALTIGGGTISDMIVQEKRGGVMAIWALGPLLGPVIGPVAGGFLAQAQGWRWVFWVLAMAAGLITVIAFLALRESYPPVLLARKVKKLRQETGNENLRSKLESPLGPGARFRLAIIRPMKLLFLSPIVLGLSMYMAVVYGYLYLLFTTITEVFEDQYHFSQGAVGLTYLGIGVGSLFGVVIFGVASDKILKAKSKSGEMKAEYRLPPMIPGSFVIPIGLFLYGWSAEKHVFWIVPILGTGIVGLGLLATFMPIQTYLVDAFTIYAASALAANTILRSLVGALLPLAGQKMYATLGLGWGNSLLAFIAIAMFPIPVIFYKYGERIRKSPRFQTQL